MTYLSTYFLAWAGLAGVFQKVVTPFGSAQQGMTLFGFASCYRPQSDDSLRHSPGEISIKCVPTQPGPALCIS